MQTKEGSTDDFVRLAGLMDGIETWLGIGKAALYKRETFLELYRSANLSQEQKKTIDNRWNALQSNESYQKLFGKYIDEDGEDVFSDAPSKDFTPKKKYDCFTC